ncbi:MAG: DUF4912 domain-containing protein [bacterium]|nr:DUF4912 domain-containing protein [bacterium]
MISTAELKSHSKVDLVKIAKRLGISGGNNMLKEDLVKAVAKASRNASSDHGGSSVSANGTRAKSNAKASAKKSSAKKSGGKQAEAEKTSATTRQGKSQRGKAAVAASKAEAAKGASSKARGGARSKTTATSSSSKERPSSAGTAKKSSRTKTPSEAKTRSKPTEKQKPVAKPSGKKTADKSAEKTVPKKPVSAKSKSKPKPTRKPTNPRVLKRIRELQLQRETSKDVSLGESLVRPPGASEPIWEKEPKKDRVSLFVRDAYWLHVSWDVTRQAIERAKAAMAEQWHSAKPVLRLLLLDDSGNNAETVERDIPIHGGLRNWYIDWRGGTASLRVMLGYLANERFHSICESNIVRTPAPGSSEDVDEHWSDLGAEGERIFALSGGYDSERETSDLKEMLEDRLHRELGAPALAKLGASADSPFGRRHQFHFDMDVELVVYGYTTTDGYLTLNGEPVALRDDGTFALRLPFPDRRQVIPAVACSRDGSQQRMIVVAVERNTKVMEPLEKEHDSLD